MPRITANGLTFHVQRSGAGPDVVRLSIGIESVADIIADLDQALEKAMRRHNDLAG